MRVFFFFVEVIDGDGDLTFTVYFYFGIAVLAPRARHSFATAQKSTQKRQPL